MWEGLIGEPYPEDAVGMTVRRHWTAQDAWVFHSEWWLREHWGRLFDVDAVARPPRADDGTAQVTHSYIALTRRDVAITKDELERCDASEPRELAALQTSVRLLRQELDAVAARLRPAADHRGRPSQGGPRVPARGTGAVGAAPPSRVPLTQPLAKARSTRNAKQPGPAKCTCRNSTCASLSSSDTRSANRSPSSTVAPVIIASPS